MDLNCVEIYLTSPPLLIIKIIKKIIFFKKLNLKNFHGIYIKTNKEDRPIINNLKSLKDYPTISYHIVSLAYRFKRLKINKSEREYYSLPFRDDLEINLRDTISTIDLIIKRYRLDNKLVTVYLKKFQDKYINIYFKRYYEKKYNINIKFIPFGIQPKTDSQITFKKREYNILSLFSIFKRIPFRKRNNLRKFKNKKILEVVSMNKLKSHYKLPTKNKSLKKIISSIDFNEISNYGLNKHESFLFFLKQFTINFKEKSFKYIYQVFKYNLFLDCLQININKIYIHNISKFLNKIDIKYLFCSHRSFYLEKLIYKACKLNNVKSISYDFSLGYPLRNTYKKEISLTTKPDIYIVSSTLRKGHYKYANMDYTNSGNSLKIINCSCIQVEYARNKVSRSKTANKKNRNNIISIFDNNYGENASIRLKYTKDLVKILSNYRNNISCVVHSKIKYFYLENELHKSRIRYMKALKGDFNLAAKSNLIISIGFQGAAIKAAFAFNKPIIFFSSDESYYDNFIFSDDSSRNKITLEKFKRLIFNTYDIHNLLSSKNQYYSNLENIRSISSDFLELIGFSNEVTNIFSYLEAL